jgi:ABC-type uncharacterized transport system fused permease/ATPase subunit
MTSKGILPHYKLQIVAVIAAIGFLGKRSKQYNVSCLRSTSASAKQMRQTSSKDYLGILRYIAGLLGVKECSLLAGLIVALISHANMEVQLLELMTSVEKSLFFPTTTSKGFYTALREYSFFALPSSILSALYSYVLQELNLSIRKKLSDRLLEKFMQDKVYHDSIVLSHLSSKKKEHIGALNNADQVLAHDLDEFVSYLCSLLSRLFKPSVDIAFSGYRLYQLCNDSLPMTMAGYVSILVVILTYLRAPLGVYQNGEQLLEGEYRHVIARVVQHAEQVASFLGGQNELQSIQSKLQILINYCREHCQVKSTILFLDQLVAKHWLAMVSWELIYKATTTHSSINPPSYEHIQNVWKLVRSVCQASTSLIVSGRDVIRTWALGGKMMELEALLNSFVPCNLDHDDRQDVVLQLDEVLIAPPFPRADQPSTAAASSSSGYPIVSFKLTRQISTYR